LIIESEPFELINGDLLDLPKEFLNKIFEGLKEKRVMVVGIVGPQSSGKSTLLNFVLGCDFLSSAGRCTKGVYGTYYEITNK
jgi:pantothenate kinase-related protein Tda10